REHFLIHIGDEQVFPTVVVQIACVHAHSGAGLAVVAETDLRGQRYLLPFAIAAVYEQEILHRVVGDEEIHPSVIIDVRSYYAEALAHRPRDVGPLRDFGERAVAVVVEQKAGGRLEYSRDAIIMPSELVVAAAEARLGPIVNETAREQIQAAVVVLIDPDRAR